MLRANLKAELAVLSTLCNTKNKEKQGSIWMHIRPEYFGTDASRELFDRINEVVSDTDSMPSFKALRRDHHLSDAAKALVKSHSGDVCTTAEIDVTLGQLKDSFKVRVVADLNDSLADKIASSRVPKQADIEKILEAALFSIRNPEGSTEDLMHGGIGDDRPYEILEGILAGESMKNRIRTGWGTFDARSGGFQRGNLVVMTANFGGGKSVAALTLFRNMHNMNHSAALATLEMGHDETMERMLSCISGIEYNKIRLGRLSPEEKKKITKAFKRFDDKSRKARWTYYRPTNEVTIKDVFRALAPYKYDIIFIDYIGLLKQLAMAKNAREDQMLGEAARYCKIMAQKLNCVVILLAQLNDEGKVFGARAITHHADFWFKWQTTEEDKTRGFVVMEQGKARGAETYDFTLTADFAHMNMSDYTGASQDEIDAVKQEKRESKTGRKPQRGEKSAEKPKSKIAMSLEGDS